MFFICKNVNTLFDRTQGTQREPNVARKHWDLEKEVWEWEYEKMNVLNVF